MKIIKNKYSITSLLVACYLFLAPVTVSAMCPVCTVGVIAGLGIAEEYGVSDVITGIWFGGLIISMAIWTNDWLKKKKWIFWGYSISTVIIYYAAVILPLYWRGKIGSPFHTFWGIDKLILGILLGSIFFTLGALGYKYLKTKNNNKAYFPFQKVVMPIAPLIILTIVFYYLTK